MLTKERLLKLNKVLGDNDYSILVLAQHEELTISRGAEHDRLFWVMLTCDNTVCGAGDSWQDACMDLADSIDSHIAARDL